MTTRVTTEHEREHPPAVSGTPTAWLTLGLLLAAVLCWAFANPLSCLLIRGGLEGAAFWRGDRLILGDISWTPDGALQIRAVEWRGLGVPGGVFRSDRIAVWPARPHDALLQLLARRGKTRWISGLQVGRGELLVDGRGLTGPGPVPAGGLAAITRWPSGLLPEILSAGPMDVTVVGEQARVAFRGLMLRLPEHWTGRLSYDEASVEAGSWHHRLPKASVAVLREGAGLRIGSVDLGDGIALGSLDLGLRGGRCEFGFRGNLGSGLLRGDGSVELARPDRLDLTLVGESLALPVLNDLFSLGNRATGGIRQARFTFRGTTTKPLDADASLRLVARDFRWEGRGWEALRLSASLTGRKLTLGELDLHQGENLVTATGESLLPQDWHEALQAPFTADFRASLEDAGSLSSLVGRFAGLKQLGGAMELEGRIRGSRNRAEGYCNLTGWDMTCRDLPLDWIRGCLLFEGDRSRLTYLEARSGKDVLTAEGTVSNDGRHAYSGKATLSVGDLTRRMSQMGVSTAAVIGGGACKASWLGSGELDGPAHEGSFRADVTEWVSRWTKSGMSGSFEGTYAPGRLELGKAEFFQDDLRLSMKLAASRERLTASGVSALRGSGKTPLLEGGVDLPLDATELWRTGDLPGTIRPGEGLSVDLAVHGIRAEELSQLFGQPDLIRGRLEGRLRCSGSLRDPDATLALGVAGFAVAREEEAPREPADLRITAYAQHHESGLWADATRSGKLLLSGHLLAPIRDTLAPGDKLSLRPVNLLSGDVTFQDFDAGEWLALAGAGEQPFRSCILRGWVGFGGPPRSPRLTGSLDAEAAAFDLPGLDPLVDPSAHLELLPGRVSVTGGTASFRGAPVTFGGDLEQVAGGLRGAVHASGKSLPLTLWPGITGRADAETDLRILEGHPSGIDGSVVLREAALTGTPALTPRLIDFGPGVPGKTTTPGLPLTLTLRTPSPLPLGGSGSAGSSGSEAATLGLDLHASGRLGAPLWTGTIEIGNLSLRGPRQDLFLPHGVLVMEGNVPSFRQVPLWALTCSGMEGFVMDGPAGAALLHPGVTALGNLLLAEVPSPPTAGRRHGVRTPQGPATAPAALPVSRIPFAPGWLLSTPVEGGMTAPPLLPLDPLPWAEGLPAGRVSWGFGMVGPAAQGGSAEHGFPSKRGVLP